METLATRNPLLSVTADERFKEMAENMASPPAESGLADADENIMNASTASELTRIFNSAGIIPGPVGGYLSFNPDGHDEDDYEDEEGAEDFVAVDHDDAPDYSYLFRRPSQGKQRTALDELYPFTSVLTVNNVEDCVTVEEVFPEHERASREKVCLTCWFFVIVVLML